MNENSISAGDVVELKSGGPLMTVEGVDDNVAKCTWFDNDGDYCSNIFSKKALKKA